MKVTYPNESPTGIRKGDKVTFNGETFTAYSDAEFDQYGDINVNDGSKWRTFSDNDKVTLEFDDDYAELTY